ncbi:MAG TPA: type IV toxin-antitoxin system AbiEi family antitoxin [Bacillota bacterium]|nr:type IV toxin-antitoxin system AbiEi family antitoxin [Bacillota bacterium]HOH10970.1 type IV toxin-antitoxin system AbiEi family antitoxin [Bacillota bacterium]HPI01850.1 type IV toxin-antitoxin system AbiEi family antitoxin [Bacillota bacterium]HPM64446.1 type IV toxin-antitoxin system AbiEi family antitoxin [Bacillota bacterium]
MKRYEKLLSMEIFNRNEVVSLYNNAKSADSILYNYIRKGYIASVKRNLYVAISPYSKQPVANRFQIASRIKDDSYITHHTAFEYHGCANQVFFEVYVASARKFQPFAYDGYTYRYIAPRIDTGTIKKPDGVMVTDMERTILDGINDFDRIGGFEELLRCIELVLNVDEGKLMEYLKLYNSCFMYQKAGYILDRFKEQLHLTEGIFETCEAAIGKSVRYLYQGVRMEKPVFDRRWQLVVPESLTDKYI